MRQFTQNNSLRVCGPRSLRFRWSHSGVARHNTLPPGRPRWRKSVPLRNNETGLYDTERRLLIAAPSRSRSRDLGLAKPGSSGGGQNRESGENSYWARRPECRMPRPPRSHRVCESPRPAADRSFGRPPTHPAASRIFNRKSLQVRSRLLPYHGNDEGDHAPAERNAKGHRRIRAARSPCGWRIDRPTACSPCKSPRTCRSNRHQFTFQCKLSGRGKIRCLVQLMVFSSNP